MATQTEIAWAAGFLNRTGLHAQRPIQLSQPEPEPQLRLIG